MIGTSTYTRRRHAVATGDDRRPDTVPTVAARGPASPSLRVNTSWMLTAQIVYSLCQFGTLAVLARLGSTDTVGQFVLGLAVTAPIVMFCNLQLRVALATDSRGEYPLSDYLLLRYVTCLLALAVIGVVALVVGGLQATAAVIAAVGIAKIIESLSDIRYGSLQRCEAIPIVARSTLIRGPASLAAILLVYGLTQNLAAACLAMAGAWLVVLLAHDIPSSCVRQCSLPGSRPDRTRPVARRLLPLAGKALPLGLAAGVFSLEANVPRYVVGGLFGSSELGIFGAIVFLMAVGQTVVTSLTYATIARLANLHSSGQARAYRRVLGRVLAVSAVLGVGLLCVMGVGGRQILGVLYGADYAREYRLLAIVSLAAAIQLSNGVLTTALQSMRRFKTVFAVRALSLTVTAAFSIVLADLYGLEGVGWGLVVAAALQGTVLAWLLWSLIGGAPDAAVPVAESELAGVPSVAAI